MTSVPAGSASDAVGVRSGLLNEERFRRYALARFSAQVAQTALIYGLFIEFIVTQDSAVATSAFVLASVIPSILLSVPGGVAGDILPKKGLIIFVLILRILLALALIQAGLGIGEVLALTFVIWTVYQFYTPPENVALLAVVPLDRVPAATSLLQALSLASQMVGAGLIAPVLVKFVSEEALFYAVIGLLLTAIFLYASLPRLSPPEQAEKAQLARTLWWKAMPQGLRLIRSNAALRRMTFLRALLDTGLMMVMVAAPSFIQDVLDTGAENAVYIAVPGALGIAAGLVISPILVSLLRPVLVVGIGYVCFVGTVLALAFVHPVSNEVSSLTGPLTDAAEFVGLSREIFATAVVLPIGGMGVSLVQVAARAGTYRAVSGSTIGQVLATQSGIGSLIAMLPTFFSGVLLDVLPVRTVLIGIGVGLALLALLVLVSRPSGGGQVQGEADST